MIRWRFLLFLVLVVAGAPVVHADSEIRPILRISVENTESHVQTRFVRRFADALRAEAGDRLDVRFFPNSRLFRGSDVIYALEQGRVEMAVPGSWHLSRAVPDVSIFLLPVFYGQTAELNHRLLAGAVGEALTARIEETLRVRVLGSWFDLGHAHLFGVGQPIRGHENLKGLRIRVPGGPANGLRIETFGGRPTAIPWPDLPAWLDRGEVDGLLTTCATVVSARLWEHGVTSAFLDREYFPQYVPLIAAPFWRNLSPDLRQAMSRIWAKLVPEQRRAAAADQSAAVRTLAANGVTINRPAQGVLDQWRDRLRPLEERMVRELGIDPAVYRLVLQEAAIP